MFLIIYLITLITLNKIIIISAILDVDRCSHWATHTTFDGFQIFKYIMLQVSTFAI